MAIKHTASTAMQVHKRTSMNEVIPMPIVHQPATEAKGNFGPWPAYSKAEWRSRADLAEALASSYRGKGRDVEIIVAVRDH